MDAWVSLARLLLSILNDLVYECIGHLPKMFPIPVLSNWAFAQLDNATAARSEPPTSGVPLVTHERNTSLFHKSPLPSDFCLVFLESMKNQEDWESQEKILGKKE